MDFVNVIQFVVPALVFLIFIVPLWLFLHYRSKTRDQSALTEEERAELESLAIAAQRMGQRIETLEAILDADTPEWRNRLASDR